MKLSSSLSVSVLLVALPAASAKLYFKEQFNDEDWTKRWTQPTKWKKAAEMGKFEHTAGLIYGDANDKGIKTSEDSRFYGLSAKLTTPFVSDGKKDLVLQYVVRHEQDPKLDCGGAYLKLLPGGKKFNAASFGGDTPYAVMFGPDVCGTTKRTHVIFHYDKKQENLLVKKDILCETDTLSHLYTLILKPDNTFEVFIDKKSVRQGTLAEEFDFLEPKEIKDPAATKPDDWVDNDMMDDPADKKPDDWDSIPKEIADPDAKKPDDWVDEDDGDWEPAMIPNPDYKGEWKPKRIENPNYKGKWVHPMIPNPDFIEDPELYKVCRGEGCTHVGFELWQVMSGTLFDDILVTDSLDEAFEFADSTFFKRKDAEIAMKEEKDKEKSANTMDMDGMDMDGMGGMDDMDDDDMMGGMGDEF